MKKINLRIGLTVLLLLVFLFNSCIFNKEIKQDERLNSFRSMVYVILDSLDDPLDRVVAFDSLIVEIDNDKNIVSDRKRNKLLAEIYYVIGNEYYSIDSCRKAIEALSKPIELNPNSADAYYNRGCAYQSARRYEKALDDYNKAISLKADYTNAIYNRGLVYQSLEDYESAVADFQKVISMNPSYKVDAYCNLGAVYLDMDMYGDALKTLDKALSLDSTNVDGYLLRADVYIERRQYDSVIGEYNKVLAFSPDALDIMYKRGKIYELIGEHNKAQEDFKYILDADSEDFQITKIAKKEIRDFDHLKKDSPLHRK